MRKNKYIKNKERELEILYELIENEDKIDDKALILEEISKVKTSISNHRNKKNKIKDKKEQTKKRREHTYYINKKHKERDRNLNAHLRKCDCFWCKDVRKNKYKFDENWKTDYFVEDDFLDVLNKHGIEKTFDYINSEASLIPIYKRKSKSKYKKVKLIKTEEFKTKILVKDITDKNQLSDKPTQKEFTRIYLTFEDLESGKKLKVDGIKELLNIEITMTDIYNANEILRELFKARMKLSIMTTFV